MSRIDDFFPSRFLKADDLEGGEETLLIEQVAKEKMRDPRGGPDIDKPVVHFQHCEKAMILNKMNATVIAKLHGSDTDNWVGRPVTLFATTTDVGGETYDVIRIRPQVLENVEEFDKF